MVNHIKAMKDCILEQNIKKKKNKTKNQKERAWRAAAAVVGSIISTLKTYFSNTV